MKMKDKLNLIFAVISILLIIIIIILIFYKNKTDKHLDKNYNNKGVRGASAEALATKARVIENFDEAQD